MNERIRLLIHTAGVLVVFTIIILMRFLFYYQDELISFLRSEFIFYILGISVILIFTQFLISTTYSSKPPIPDENDTKSKKKQKELQEKIEKTKKLLRQHKQTVDTLKSEKKVLKKNYAILDQRLKDFELQIQNIIVSDKSLISRDLALINPLIHVQENHFFSMYENLNELASKGIDSYQLESSIAYIGSFQIYNMLTNALKETNEFKISQVDDMLYEYASLLNDSLTYVEVVNYGYKNIYEPSSHITTGFIDEHDQVTPKTFKVNSRDTGSIIYKALVRKV